MHFLSHYYVDRSKNNPLFVLGALLPDIAPQFTKTYNSKIRYKEWEMPDDIRSIHLGVLRHYQVDAVFHNSPVFKDACKNAGECMTNEGLDREKYRFWFLSHIASELILDFTLIADDPKLVTDYYNVLISVDTNKLSAYLNYIVSEDEKTKILTNFMRFIDVRFLRYFDKIDGVAEGITRTAHRAIGVTFTDIDRRRLIAALHNIGNDIRYRSEKLLEV